MLVVGLSSNFRKTDGTMNLVRRPAACVLATLIESKLLRFLSRQKNDTKMRCFLILVKVYISGGEQYPLAIGKVSSAPMRSSFIISSKVKGRLPCVFPETANAIGTNSKKKRRKLAYPRTCNFAVLS
jgi:hypothetical protein